MEWIFVETKRIEVRRRIKKQWSELTDDHLDAISGNRAELVNKIEEKFGVSPQNADLQVSEWESRNQDLFEETAAQIKPFLGIAKQ